MSSTPSPVLAHALDLPNLRFLKDKRVVLASSSPRRKELLEMSGLKPEVVPSMFAEDLPHDAYINDLAQYPIDTAKKVYERMFRENPGNAPDLVISADTIVIFPPQTDAEVVLSDQTATLRPARLNGLDTNFTNTQEQENRDKSECSGRKGVISRILEKPMDRDDQLRTLSELNGQTCEIITGVTIGKSSRVANGLALIDLECRSVPDCGRPGIQASPETLQAYIANGEGLDRSGGFAAQGLGAFLVKSVSGEYHNVAGFPLGAFWRWMGEMYEGGAFD